MDATAALASLGGTGRARDLVPLCGRRSLRRALDTGTVVRAARGRYVLAGADRVTRVVATANGVRSGLAAAESHGWQVLREAVVLEVAVPVGRAVPRQPGVQLHRHDATPEERR